MQCANSTTIIRHSLFTVHETYSCIVVARIHSVRKVSILETYCQHSAIRNTRHSDCTILHGRVSKPYEHYTHRAAWWPTALHIFAKKSFPTVYTPLLCLRWWNHTWRPPTAPPSWPEFLGILAKIPSCPGTTRRNAWAVASWPWLFAVPRGFYHPFIEAL